MTSSEQKDYNLVHFLFSALFIIRKKNLSQTNKKHSPNHLTQNNPENIAQTLTSAKKTICVSFIQL